MQGPAAYREGTSPESEAGNKPPAEPLLRQSSSLKPTDRCQRVLVSQESISASVTPQVERMLQVGVGPLQGARSIHTAPNWHVSVGRALLI